MGLIDALHGPVVSCEHIETTQANHPVPDQAGEQASRRILDMVLTLSADDLVVCLISGGETTVTLKSKGGRAGRSAEFLLGFA